MPSELKIGLETLVGFLMVLARMSGALVMVPMPAIRKGLAPARVVLALCLAVAMYPKWPAVDLSQVGLGWMVMVALSEAALGLSIGLVVALVTESLLIAMQVVGLQAGYGFSSMVDPATEADSSILPVLGQLTASLLFFALGLDREVIRIFAYSLDTTPVGTFFARPAQAEILIHLGAGMFVTGLRLAMPAVALLILADLSLALMGRINAQLQLLGLTFPTKMLAALLVLAVVAPTLPRVYGRLAADGLQAARGLLGG